MRATKRGLFAFVHFSYTDSKFAGRWRENESGQIGGRRYGSGSEL